MQARGWTSSPDGFSPSSSLSHSHNTRARRIELSQGDHAWLISDDSCLNEVIKPLGVFAFVVFALMQLSDRMKRRTKTT